uniref:Capping protein regulator and myosin 1 linker 2 n=1 Tax=Cyanoderma ruficeps TaxID=181631 RepID=A0A8C3QW06_9PASS
MLFSWPTLTHLSAPSSGRCSRTAPPACTRGSTRSQTHWRKCCRATLGLVVSPAITSLRQDQEGWSTLGTIPTLHPSTAPLLTAPTSASRAPVMALVRWSPATGACCQSAHPIPWGSRKGEPSASLLSPCHPSPVSHSPQSSPLCPCGKVCPQNCLLFAGGFSETYAALCDYNGFAFREEIQWDVDNIYHSQDCREFNLLDFSHLESRDVALSVAALSFNLWFTKLSCKDFRLVSEISEQLLYMLSKSVTLEELVLENSGDFVQRMAQALSSHPNSALHTINLAGNQLEDRGIQTLGWDEFTPTTACSLRHVSLAGTKLPADVVRCDWAAGNGFGVSTAWGDLGQGWWGGWMEGAVRGRALGRMPSPASHSHCLDCWGCPMGGAGAPISCTHWRGFGEFSRALLQGLADNSHISDLHLDLSSCELRSAGAQVIQDLIPDASSISHLDLSDNGFDPDMVTLVLSIGRSKSIRHVSLGKNFNIKSKEGLLDVLHRIVQLTQEEDCPLQSLSVAESRLKLGTNVLLSALGSNTSLVSLDISGNAMGDTGAKMLAKQQLHSTMWVTLCWVALMNYTLKSMPLPMSDVAQAYRSNPERTEEAVHKVGGCGLGNAGPGATITQGILTTSSEQMVNEICLSVQKHVDILSTCTGREVEMDILCAEEAIRNANLSVSVSPRSAAAGPIPGCAAKPPRTLPAGTATLPSPRRSRCPADPPRVGEGDGVGDDDGDDDDDDGEAWRGRVSTGTLSPVVGVSELEPAAGRDASGLRAHRAPPSLSPAAPPARPASTKDAEPASGSLPATQPATATGFLMDLPTAGEKLEHCTKARPRPNRRHKQPPSKPNVRGGMAGKGGGVYSVCFSHFFFRLGELLRSVFVARQENEIPTTPETCLGSAPLAPSGSRTLKKKIGNFFAFKKPKSSRGSRCEKEPEGGPTAPRSRRSMLSDILRAPSKAGESGKPLSKSEEGGLSAEPHAEPEHCQTPDSARRIRPKYSREGKSQSLILLSGEDEDALGVRHDKKRHLEKSEGELSSSFEQRMQVMLHRIGVTKGPAADSKKHQVGTGSIFWDGPCPSRVVGDGDIVDSSADSPPSLKARTHSVSTGGSAVDAGGSHQPLGQRALSPLLAPSIGTGANRDWWAQAYGQNSTLGRVPYTHGCPSLVMADGHPAHCPVPGLAAGWFPAPRTVPGAVTSGRPQLHPACPTDAPFRSPAARTEPGAEPRPAWKALGRQLPAEPPATSSDQPRRSFTLAEPSGLPEPGGREGWSSSLPRLGRNVPVALPRRVSHGGEVGAGTLPTLPTPPNTEGRDA